MFILWFHLILCTSSPCACQSHYNRVVCLFFIVWTSRTKLFEISDKILFSCPSPHYFPNHSFELRTTCSSCAAFASLVRWQENAAWTLVNWVVADSLSFVYVIKCLCSLSFTRMREGFALVRRSMLRALSERHVRQRSPNRTENTTT